MISAWYSVYADCTLQSVAVQLFMCRQVIVWVTAAYCGCGLDIGTHVNSVTSLSSSFFLLTLNNHRLHYITVLSVDTKGIEMLVWCGLQLIQYINMCSSPIHCVLIKKTTIYVPCCVMLVLQCWLIVAWVASMILQMKIRSIETEQRGRDVSFEETFKSHTVSLATFP